MYLGGGSNPSGSTRRRLIMTNKSEYTVEDAKKAVGPGWARLIEEIYAFIPDYLYIFQVKEKWGKLCFYTGTATDEVSDFISRKEQESLTICEICGKPGYPRRGGWITTLCDEHSEGRQGY
jgi:hypothetical protein